MLLTESKCVTNENLCIVMGPCLDPWRTGPPKAMQREVEDNVFLKFAMEVYETQLALGRHFAHEHVGSASTWTSSRMKTLREHPRCEEISGKRGAQGKEMRSSNRQTRYLSSTELLGVLDSAEAPKSPACLFRDTLRGVAAQRCPEKLQRSLHSGCAVCALDAFKKGCAAGHKFDSFKLHKQKKHKI